MNKPYLDFSSGERDPVDNSPSFRRINPRKSEHSPLNILKNTKQKYNRPAFVAGPMVRYSKLPFRELVRTFNADIVYTPMVLAREFVRNHIARLSDFTTNEKDRPVIVQVGCNNVEDLIKFVDMIHPYVDGIGLNCGCPIKEQVREGIGAALMNEPELVSSMVTAVKEKYGDKVCIDTKIRIHPNIEDTIRFVNLIEKSGVDFISVHGRTKNTRSSQPANFEAIKIVKQNVSVPVVANGDCFSLEDAYRIMEVTGVDGVMSARGILSNPTLFAGYKNTTWSAVELFWDYATSYGLPFRIFQHHLSEMLTGVIPRSYIKDLNSQDNLVDLIDWFDSKFVLRRKGDKNFATDIEPTWKTVN